MHEHSILIAVLQICMEKRCTCSQKLLKAHQNNDRAVMQAYGFSVKDMTESPVRGGIDEDVSGVDEEWKIIIS